ncbi:hypothetical protein [Paenibacillus sp. MMO-177]|uniref:hypothetical protein n=1 Tax=Paenibacillus sp. MMO-177 TaxID=3081289 RepID=UPI00301815CD
MKLIMVEGIPGSGKSSTARFIALQLERNGYPVELYHESTVPHPILLDEDLYDLDRWLAAYRSKWNSFLAANAAKESVIVMESVLFQAPIIQMLHMDIDSTVIIRFIEELMVTLSRFDCGFVYLYQKDPSVGINRMLTDRGGESWLRNTYDKFKHLPYYKNRNHTGKELHLQFLHEYSQIAQQIFNKMKLKSMGVDNTNWDWDQDYRTIMDFLGCTIYPDPELSKEELEKFSGSYQNDELGITFHIQLRGEDLYIFDHYKLKPRGENTFYLSNISMSLAFIGLDEVMVYEKDIVGNRNDLGTVFVRIT